MKRYGEFLATFGERLPAGIKEQLDRIVKRVAAAGGSPAAGAGAGARR